MWIEIRTEIFPQGKLILKYFVGDKADSLPYKLEYIDNNSAFIVCVGNYRFKYTALLALKLESIY